MITKVGEHIYEVPSDTSHGKVYLVDTRPGRDVTCTCTAYAIKRNKVSAKSPGAIPTKVRGRKQDGYCKHVKQVMAEIITADKDEAQATAAEFERIRITESLRATMRELA